MQNTDTMEHLKLTDYIGFGKKRLTVDTCSVAYYDETFYETMVLDENGSDLFTACSGDLEQAKQNHADALEQFMAQEQQRTPADVYSLIVALRNAKTAANEFIDAEDGGTCNFDSPTLDYRALRMSKAKAEHAILAAGLHCFDWSCYGTRYLVISGYGAGQGDRRTAMAEAAQKSLKAQGIPSGMYYQAD